MGRDVKDGVNIEETMSMLDNIATRNDVAAIGETGIDRLRGASEEIQTHIFIHHIKLAEHTGKPLIIHCVKALDIILRLHKEHRPSSPWIIHGFRGNAETARQITSRGIYLSLGEKFNPDAILNIPPHLLLAETDVEHRHGFFDIVLSGKPRVYSYGVMFPVFEAVEEWIDGYDAVGR